ncbi:hypothetical protein AB0L30_24355 [Microbispora rosea]|uniref:hypothetical protein n=1 Tax=Microbispora rosea TaxID=58117 RepID=UPI0034279574
MLPDTDRRAGANPYAAVPALLRTPRLVVVYAATLTILGALVALYTAFVYAFLERYAAHG